MEKGELEYTRPKVIGEGEMEVRAGSPFDSPPDLFELLDE